MFKKFSIDKHSTLNLGRCSYIVSQGRHPEEPVAGSVFDFVNANKPIDPVRIPSSDIVHHLDEVTIERLEYFVIIFRTFCTEIFSQRLLHLDEVAVARQHHAAILGHHHQPVQRVVHLR